MNQEHYNEMLAANPSTKMWDPFITMCVFCHNFQRRLYWLLSFLLDQTREYRDMTRFDRGGLTRNDQLATETTKWVWFADCDHVYHPQFVERLRNALEHRETSGQMLSRGRLSTSVEPTDKAVDASIRGTPDRVIDVFGRARQLEPLVRHIFVGAGHTQIAPFDGVHQGVYVADAVCRDWSWAKRY
jgi:hypothetical protein